MANIIDKDIFSLSNLILTNTISNTTLFSKVDISANSILFKLHHHSHRHYHWHFAY